ncbi:hypothetical protein HPP92_002372 [Vanilla planifolia]|uniref:Uncharacterized protein n=1 Tax=Vanilla planifolia TaxID=51239 RepID=A0A835VIG2_VANPL|nr:hypothetical protein HPP92_002372 [Vanilla planifolia]
MSISFILSLTVPKRHKSSTEADSSLHQLEQGEGEALLPKLPPLSWSEFCKLKANRSHRRALWACSPRPLVPLQGADTAKHIDHASIVLDPRLRPMAQDFVEETPPFSEQPGMAASIQKPQEGNIGRDHSGLLHREKMSKGIMSPIMQDSSSDQCAPELQGAILQGEYSPKSRNWATRHPSAPRRRGPPLIETADLYIPRYHPIPRCNTPKTQFFEHQCGIRKQSSPTVSINHDVVEHGIGFAARWQRAVCNQSPSIFYVSTDNCGKSRKARMMVFQEKLFGSGILSNTWRA